MPIVFFDVDGGEDVLPAPLLCFIRIFAGEGEGEGDLAITSIAVFLVGFLDDAEVVLEGLDQLLRSPGAVQRDH
jgi:hypothetical protein